MKIIVDTRENKALHVVEHFANQGIPFKLKKLEFGDYSIEGHENRVMVERKAHLTELANCFCAGRCRFEKEFIRATEAGAKIHLLIEEHDGRERLLKRRELDKDRSLTAEQRQKGTWRSNFVANAMIASLESWIKKYNINLLFVSKKESGRVIIEIFQKYLEEVGTNE